MNHLMHQDEILLQIVNRLDRTDREMKRIARHLENVIETSTNPPTSRPPEKSERPPIILPAP